MKQPSPSTHLQICRRLPVALLIGCWLFLSMSTGVLADTLRLGVLSFRPLEETRQQWRATAAYLEHHLPGHHVELQAYYYADMDHAVRTRQLDFVLTNPEHYVLLRGEHRLAATATLMPLVGNQPVTQFGGVILTRGKRSDINTLEDLRGKVIAAPEEKSLGAYLMQRWTLYKAGVDLGRGDATLQFTGMPHDKSVEAVLSGRADAGFVRTGVVEAMLRQGRLQAGDVKIIHRQDDGRFPLLRSTDLYPEWPFSIVSDKVPDTIAKAATLALLNIAPDHPAAHDGHYYGFAPPGDYSDIEAIMLRLRLHPQSQAGFDLQDVASKYSTGLFLALTLLCLFGFALAWRFRQDRERFRHLSRELQHSQVALQTAKEAAEQADQVKTRFLATMSHELRTPLNGIMGMAQVMQTETLSAEERKEFAGIILDSGQDLVTLLSDILEVADLESGQITLLPTATRPDVVLSEIHLLFADLAANKGLALQCEWQGPAEQSYLVDAKRLRQLLSALISNALKFTERGAIRVTGQAVDCPPGLLRFTVADNGPGIPPERLDKLFTSFSQLDTSSTRAYPGAGLGLSIVRRLCEAMGGEAGVESTPGQGSRFWFTVRTQIVD